MTPLDPPSRGGESAVPLVIVLAILQAGITSGLDVRSALAGLGTALDGVDADAHELTLTAQRLAVGLAWDESWPAEHERLRVVERALASSWRTGSSPILALESARHVERQRSRAAADRAAAELGVRLTLPLAICLLPAFLLVGIVPLLLSIAAGLLGDVTW
jgi:hypothetical protein